MKIKLRKLQYELENVIDEIISGKPICNIDIVATPGAGKSSIPIQACRLIYEGLADSVLWIVPRSSLQDQGERGFIDPFFRKMFQHDFIIRSSTNEINPRRGTNGFVTTYQAIGIDKKNTVLNEVKPCRYIVILDEFHHLEKDGVWHESLKNIIDSSEFFIKMTGTLGRGDKSPIAYVNYSKNKPIFPQSNDSRLITYTRIDALKEQAILPIEFHLHDGNFKWKTPEGKQKSVSSFNGAFSSKMQTESLYTALHSEFSLEMINDCVKHWINHKRFNPRSKLLIVAADKKSAKNAKSCLDALSIISEIATSHERIGIHDINAQQSIKNFKGPYLDCLVTIAMAYEGLDVPAITHICVLTNIRSKEWIEQMVARGVRIDKSAGPYKDQMCYVFAPADKQFKKVVDMIEREQVSSIDDEIEDGLIIPCKKCTHLSKMGICSHNPGPDNFECVMLEGQECLYFEPKPPQEQKKIIPISSEITARERFEMGFKGNSEAYHELVYIQKTIKEQETELRKKISRHINVFSFENRYEPWHINKEVAERFGKKRNLMTLKELQELFKYICKSYRLLSQPVRGTHKRVSNEIKRAPEIKQSFYGPIDQLLPGIS